MQTQRIVNDGGSFVASIADGEPPASLILQPGHRCSQDVIVCRPRGKIFGVVVGLDEYIFPLKIALVKHGQAAAKALRPVLGLNQKDL